MARDQNERILSTNSEGEGKCGKCGRSSDEGAFAFAVRPSASRTQPSMPRSSRLERARTRVAAAPRAFPFDGWRLVAHVTRTREARRHKSRRSPRPILRAPHDVADVLYYRLTKVMWRDSPPGHGDRDASEQAGARREKKKKKREEERSEKRAKKFQPRCPTSFLSLSPRSTRRSPRCSTFISRTPVVPRFQIVVERNKRTPGTR